MNDKTIKTKLLANNPIITKTMILDELNLKILLIITAKIAETTPATIVCISSFNPIPIYNFHT